MNMEKYISNAVSAVFGTEPLHIEPLGGGFYGRAFALDMPNEPYKAVAKAYLFLGFAEKEAEQLSLLRQYCTLQIPKVFGVYKSEYEILLMSYVPGTIAAYAYAEKMDGAVRKNISDEIVDNLLAWHNISCPDGFGYISGEKFSTWQEFYYPTAKEIVKKAERLYNKGQITRDILSVFEKSILKFDEIFYLPVTKSGLVHGDYNTWNIMLNEELTHAHAVIDPFNCSFADTEFDLFQLENANGKQYGLLENYASKARLSDNFPQKRAFYELYSEVGHYHDSGVQVDIPRVEVFAENLKKFLL